MLIILCFWLISISMHYSEWGGRWRWGMIYIVLRCYWGARGPQPPCYLSQLSLYLFASCMACPELAWWQMFFLQLCTFQGSLQNISWMYLIFSQIYTCSYTYQLYHIPCHIKAQFLSQVYRPTLFHSWCTIFTLYIARGYEYILRVYKLSGSKTFSLHQMHLYVAFKVASGISVCKHCDKVWNQLLP